MKKPSAIVIFLIVTLLSVPAFASNGLWDNNGVTSPNWDNVDNWYSFTTPGATSGTTNTDVATFNIAIGANDYGTSSSPIIIDPGRNIGGINFDTAAGNYYIGSTSLNPLLLTSGGTIQILDTLTSTNAIETINAPLVIEGASGTYTFSNNSANGAGAGAGTLDIGGGITGGAAGATVLTLSGSNTNSNTISGIIANGNATSLAITKSGVGTWVLSGANTYSGGTTVNAGTLTVTGSSGLGATTGTLSVNNTNTGAGTDVVLNLSTTAPTTTGSLSGTIATPSGGTNTDTINNGGELFTVNQTTNGTFAGVITGAGGFTLGSLSTATLTLSGDNTYSGGTMLDAGTLNLGSSSAVGTGTITFNGGTLQYSAASAGTDYSSQFSNAADQEYNIDTNGQSPVALASNLTSSGGALTKIGSGTLTLSGDNTYNGGTILDAGTLDLDSTNAIGTGTITFNGGTLQYNVASNGIDYSSQFSNAADQEYSIDTNGQTVTFLSALTSSGGSLTKIGSGTLTLSGDNTYSGGTIVDGGTLTATGTSGLGATTGTLSVNNINTGAGTAVILNLSTTAPTTTGSLSGTIATPSSGTNTDIINNGGQSFTVNQTTNGTFAGVITGAGGFTLGSLSTATLTLSGDNTYMGGTMLDAGTLNLGSSSAVGTGTITFNGGTLQYSAASSGTDYSSQFSNVADQAYKIDTNGQTVLLTSNLTSSGGTLTKIDSGTLTLTGDNTYNGGTTLDAGTLNLGSVNAIGTGTITFDGGTLQYSAASAGTDYSSQFSNAADQQYSIDTNGLTVTLASALTSNGGTLTEMGNGILVLSGANTYTGATAIETGTLQLGNSGAIPDTSDVSIASSGTLDLHGNSATIGSLAGAGTVTSESAGTLTLTTGGGGDNSSTTFSGLIENGSAASVGLTTEGTGTLTLSSANTYSGGTDIGSGSTIQVESTNALGTGTVTNQGTLAIGTTNLSVGGVYNQNSGSALDLTVDNDSGSLVYGKITSAVAASVAAGSTVNVNVGGYIPGNSTFEIINTGGAGVGAAPTTATSNSPLVTFLSSVSGGNLVLTAENSGFAPLANNANARALGSAIDNISNPSSDMTTVLNELEVLSESSESKITSALNTMGPVVDGGVIQNSSAALNNLISATLDRVQNALDRATSGVSSGDDSEPNGIWAKPYGSYITQGTLEGTQGYDAWNAGTVVGYDRMITDNFTLGVSGGYAYGEVDSDANNATTDVKSAQGTIYAGYQDPVLNYFIDGAGSFAWNWYDGQRDITVGDINRTADSNYNGQQYGAYLEAGYKIYFTENPVYPDLQFTPLASFQWTHLSLDSYTETNAGALDLNVNSQSYDTLESGLGASVSYPVEFVWGNFTPEVHVKWLHDFTNDAVVVTSSFTGGGGSFTSNGANPSKDGADIGTKLSFDLTNEWSLIAEADAELKDQFFGIYGSGTVRYKF